MGNKYRVHEIAKDMGVPSNDVLEILKKYFGKEDYKHMTVLEEREINVVLAHFTRMKQVDSLDELKVVQEQAKPARTPRVKAKQPPAPQEKPIVQEPPSNPPAVKLPEPAAPAAASQTAQFQNPPEVSQASVKKEEEPPKVSAPSIPAQEASVKEPPAKEPLVPSQIQTPAESVKPESQPQKQQTETKAEEDDKKVTTSNNQNKRQENRTRETAPASAGGASSQIQQPQQNQAQPASPAQSLQNPQQQGAPQSTSPQGQRSGQQSGQRPQGQGGQGQRQGGQNRSQGQQGQRQSQGGQQGQNPRQGGGFQGQQRQGQGQRQGGQGSRQGQGGSQRQGGSQGQRQQGQGNRSAGGGQRPQRPAASQARPARSQRPADPSRPQKTVSTVDANGVIRADMRAVNVDLDKYNERYEQIAPTNVKDMTARKQKLTQRSSQYNRRPQRSRGEQEAEKMRRLEMERQRRQKLEIAIPDEISVSDLAGRLKIQVAEVVKRLMASGVMASASQVIDFDTAALVAMEIGAKVEKEVIVTIEDQLIDDSEDEAGSLVERSPVVVVMGHVDHGKTSLLDAIRHANVTASEAGGITQHIGAYQVKVNDRLITFLDTPGHEAFTSMRARGAQVTDIAILVVAADDGIMPQTVEAINHAKAAEVSIIVAINKMDKPDANAEKVKQELTEYGLVPEEWGGDVICVPVSAKTHNNIDSLLEMVQLVADVKELKANPDRQAKGTVIEARLDKGRGPVATVLVQNGTLHNGDIIIAGTAVGRVRVMMDDKGNRVEIAGPSMPVEITGLAEAPSAGDTFNVVADERLARQLVEERKQQAKEAAFQAYNKVTLENLFAQIEEGEIKELPIIVKADVQGSVEAVKQSLEKLSTSEVRVKVVHGGVGAVNESDVMLANASQAIIVGFNVRPDPVARSNAERDSVEIKLYRVIYDAIEEIESAMKGMLAPKTREVEIGRAEVRMVYKISNVGIVAGCYILEGKVARNNSIRIVRDGIIVADDKIDSLKRLKDDAKEVQQGFECGIHLSKFNDIKDGDILEAYEIEEYREE